MAEAPRSPELLANWREGARRFNAGEYWEAHEAWERGWRTLPEPEREYIQGLIQAAGAIHLAELGRPVPAARLARRAIERLVCGDRVRTPKPDAPGLVTWLGEFASMLEGEAAGNAARGLLKSFKGSIQVLE